VTGPQGGSRPAGPGREPGRSRTASGPARAAGGRPRTAGEPRAAGDRRAQEFGHPAGTQHPEPDRLPRGACRDRDTGRRPQADRRESGDRQAPGRPRGSRPHAPRPARSALRRVSPGRRLNVTLACVIFVLTLFAGRLVQLQGLDSARFKTLASKTWTTPQPVSIPVLRGSVTASNGAMLAMTVQDDQIYADPGEIPASGRAHEAAELSGPLQLPAAQILGLLNHPTAPEWVILKRSISTEAANRINGLRLPGLGMTPFYTRSYPEGDLAANLVGFTNTKANGDLTGEAGLEQEYNSLLAGRDGIERYEKTTTGEPIPGTQQMLQQPRPAGNLRLTIQPDIQYEAQQECKQRVEVTHAKDCSVIVMQARTGKILAMAQYPTFNPNGPITNLAQTADIPVANVFAPGSTAKVITVAAALEKGHQTPMSPYTVPSSIVVDGFSFHDAEPHPTARYTIAGILAYSSNDGMVQVVQHITPQQQYQYFRAFGIGSATGLGLPGESPGLLPRPGSPDYYGDTRYTLSFGQGLAANAVQMASIYQAIANGGVRVQPSVVAGTVSSEGQLRRAAAAPRRRVIKAKTAHQLMKILQQVPGVDASQGEPWGDIAGYSVASKTGTAQVPGSGCSLCHYGSSYIGVAPASNPQLVVAVNLQDPGQGYYGDVVAGPVFYNVMKFALQTRKIAPDGGRPPHIRLTAP
jgi:cell division protein FtsI (penicillin-binding protein 3)